MVFLAFEPTIPAAKRGKTVHALRRSATVTVTVSYADRISPLEQ
jgi:hypothetical protein